MAVEILIPRLGWSMDEGTLVEWLKRDGEQVAAGDMLYVLEGDKTSQEIECFDAGILRIPPDAPKPGDPVIVGQLLAYLVAEGEVAPFETEVEVEVEEGSELEGGTENGIKEQRVGPGVDPIVQEVKTDTGHLPPHSTTSARPRITPRAKRVAAELGVDWLGISGSGRGGRIREQDVRSLIEDKTLPTGELLGGKWLPITPLRRTIAQRTVAGVGETAPVTLTAKMDATRLVGLRNQVKSSAETTEVPSYADIVMKVVAMAIAEHPMIAAQWQPEGIFLPERIDLAFAVDTEEGLLAPVIRDVPNKNLFQMAVESRELAAAARSGRLSPQQMQGGVFTITNLGAFGIDAFTPIINLPQSAILGLGRIVREPVVVHDQVVAGDTMTFSLTFDHRVIDGAAAARFLRHVQQLLADPSFLLA